MEKLTCSKFMLPLLMGIWTVGELGHFLIGVVSRDVAQDIGYGDKGCFAIRDVTNSNSKLCNDIESEAGCNSVLVDNGNGSKIQACNWDHNGLGTEYQILAGPSFMACFTVAGVMWGVIADRFNRVHLLGIATIAFSLAISGTAFATQYWHLVLFRMALAAGEAACSPLAAGIIGDVFPQDKRALAMGFFNWGIYIGYGTSFAVGTYITDRTIFDEKWRTSFLISGVPGVIIGILFMLTVTEPRKNKRSFSPSPSDETSSIDNNESISTITKTGEIEEKKTYATNPKKLETENVLIALIKRPEILILGLAACIRHSAGFCWGYNSALYFQTYYPDYDAGWWLTGISIGGGAIGSVCGGYLSDRLVNRLGISARALVLAGSQLISVPFTVGLLYLEPPYAFLSLLIGYITSEMWFGVMYAILVELVPANYRSTAVGLALFVINNVGGNLPIVVDPLSSVTDYRTAIAILYPGALLTSSILFFLCWILLRKK
ncbi:unnamed protein product [Orchesella dallaii]|uniref:Major facilitator superfamily (MFS) profile domain-containing protein n=1 Tax=Orchesella dallaii TaxID=48710 RepID=A0ABP1PMU0_9HEXA